MHHFVTEMFTHVHISVIQWCIVGYGIRALWDLCNNVEKNYTYEDEMKKTVQCYYNAVNFL